MASLDLLISQLEKKIIPALENGESEMLSCKFRLKQLAGIIRFHELLKHFPIPVKIVLSTYGFHLSNCAYSADECTGSCLCYEHLVNPEKYFIVKELNQVVLRDGSKHYADCLRSKCYCNDEKNKPI
ncbi:hypothetical protein TNCT_353391 [Trichonephila clavata]|uniref:Uncharacterized protein n=1 Tax=Trichonephila clavata TaxID=2740835 RepID=A0A8X6GMU9_TRICU|nr:hypothetical protein TNCT_441821 [Trichonephila clavata]GFQ89113.1 hypothetical protein TNCT_441851 [Trichonephila clavata]GFQ95446.1 hypothetical protein TNCT_171591 [Trichonephila clavata]GFR07547.1 hypothetical protein TNCT_590831 [Trichonephila clavata]GFR08017.1 hypothetical protein TNCT_552241 [Trichonephila clavata]